MHVLWISIIIPSLICAEDITRLHKYHFLSSWGVKPHLWIHIYNHVSAIDVIWWHEKQSADGKSCHFFLQVIFTHTNVIWYVDTVVTQLLHVKSHPEVAFHRYSTDAHLVKCTPLVRDFNHSPTNCCSAKHINVYARVSVQTCKASTTSFSINKATVHLENDWALTQ